jgi:IclR family acetate operon transcriptional repressor
VAGADAPGGRGVLDGAFALLDVLGELGEAGVTRLSEAGDLPKATTYRLLEKLTTLGAVEKRNGRYRVGPLIFTLGRTWRPDPALLRAAHAPMLRLARATGASVGVGVLAHSQVVLVGAVPGERARRRVPMEPGMALSRSTAASRVLLAWAASTNPVASTRSGSAPMSTSQAEQIRAEGQAFDRQEVLPGICCAAVPLMGDDPSTPLAAVCAVVDASYPLPDLAADLTRTAAVIAASMC